MLGKLFRHEWKATWRIPTGIIIILAFLTIVGCFSFQSLFVDTEFVLVQSLSSFMLVIYYLALIFCNFAIMIYFGIRFYKNLYTDEGYLMHTLPVKSSYLILSKGFVYLIWTAISSFSVILSICILLGSAVIASGEAANIASAWNEFLTVSDPFWDELRSVVGMPVFVLVIWFILLCIIGCIFSVCVIYGAVSIGQMFQKHKVLGSILALIGIYFVIQMFSYIIAVPYMASITSALETGTKTIAMSGYLWGLIAFQAVLAAALYFLTNYLMSKHLNLD